VNSLESSRRVSAIPLAQKKGKEKRRGVRVGVSSKKRGDIHSEQHDGRIPITRGRERQKTRLFSRDSSKHSKRAGREHGKRFGPIVVFEQKAEEKLTRKAPQLECFWEGISQTWGDSGKKEERIQNTERQPLSGGNGGVGKSKGGGKRLADSPPQKNASQERSTWRKKKTSKTRAPSWTNREGKDHFAEIRRNVRESKPTRRK